MDRYQADLISHIKAQVCDKKVEISVYYSELKIKLPTYLKTLKISELRAIGGTINPDIQLPKNAEDNLKVEADSSRRKLNLDEKLASLFEQRRNDIISHYRDIKKELSSELLQARLGDLEDKFVITRA